MKNNQEIKVGFVFDRRKERDQEKMEKAVEMQLYCNRKRIYLSTGIRTLPSQWMNGKVLDHPMQKELNNTLNRFREAAFLVAAKHKGDYELSRIADEVRNEIAKIRKCNNEKAIRLELLSLIKGNLNEEISNAIRAIEDIQDAIKRGRKGIAAIDEEMNKLF